ncbi:MAG: metalloregulator ArsR/SmtB family transcription factor [Chloroflexota bacterium]|nr:metalloregulator ArsR/SmtB family transcription factor [Chloroflexota bacterium]
MSQPGNALDRTLAALADPDRRRAIDLLREGPRRAGDLAQAIGLPAPAMSRHLRVLRQSGLVEESHPEFDARVRIYSLRPGPMAELRDWLDETEALWAEQLSSFKKHVEGH